MIIRAAVGVLPGQLQIIRSIIGGSVSPFVCAILSNQQPSGQGMTIGREADRISVSVSPRERLERVFRVCRIKPCAQDCTVANTSVQGALERFDRLAGPRRSERRITARCHSTRRFEYVVTQHDVLARNILLVRTATIVEAYDAAVGR